ncbi:DNA cytosine methyltransferase [Siphonobacter curvatus]|uniref:Uncharacterized protein n=1 Tax=Siphonobacter curvatus TaxID=2094562 RepID=A0A2S7IQB4_9BACT|nr:DNA cytosine methyltransferase [Siphonobacter curvatus]PQA59828.1 hypothetical protein C5O19_09460 [Siphonobacter curvatus]
MTAEFIDQQYGQSKPSSVEDPAPCITVNPHSALVQAFIVDPQWGGHSHSIEKPAHTIIARQDKAPASIVSPEWLLTNMHKNPGTSLDEAGPTLLTGNHHYLMSTNFANVGTPLDSPAPTITADSHWAYVMTVEKGPLPAILVYESDSEPVRKIKAFMAEYGIVDIKMRMLKVQELKLIQGFPANYYLAGSQTDQKKYIGNSVPPVFPKVWVEALAKGGKDETAQHHSPTQNPRRIPERAKKGAGYENTGVS